VQAEELKLPFYVKVTIFLVGLVAFLTIIYLAKSLFIPLVFATIIAIVLHPVVNFMVRIKINRILAIILTMFLTFLVIAAFGAILISQAGKFGESWPVLVQKFTALLNQNIADAADYFNKDPQKIHDWITKTQGDIINSYSRERIGSIAINTILHLYDIVLSTLIS
jgi:predicted PurR-regulated permease PerM